MNIYLSFCVNDNDSGDNNNNEKRKTLMLNGHQLRERKSVTQEWL
jgi:hypothetical protein